MSVRPNNCAYEHPETATTLAHISWQVPPASRGQTHLAPPPLTPPAATRAPPAMASVSDEVFMAKTLECLEKEDSVAVQRRQGHA